MQPTAQKQDTTPAVTEQRSLKKFSYFNRELSWIEFNRRVLDQALKEELPLLERLRFLCIFTTNLDEFFMIRVSGLKQQVAAQVSKPTPDGLTPMQQLEMISEELRPLLDLHHRCLTQDVLPKLAMAGVRVVAYQELSQSQKRELKTYFEREIFPVLTPLVVDPSHPFPHISNLSLNLGVEVADTRDPEEKKFVRIKVPAVLPRLVPLNCEQDCFVLLEEIVTAHVGRLFPGMSVLNCHPFRITRDADIEIEEDEAEDLLTTIEDELRRRRFGLAVRLQVDASMPAHLQERLRKALCLEKMDVSIAPSPLGISEFLSLTKLRRPDLLFEPFEGVQDEKLKSEPDIFKLIRAGDILLHHPFDSFDPVVRFLQAAAHDPNVLAIKQTLYRTSGNSPIIDALITAAENGKQVAVMLELKARFDEESNIQWARALENVGAHVVYGILGLKIHSKLALVVRREEGGPRRYLHLGTGNYNPTTARVYTDIGMLTCDPDLCADASDLFNFLTGFCKQQRMRRLMVAPTGLRHELLRLIEREEKHHRSGVPGRIIIKCNAITDIEVVDALYHAGRAGVKIDLIVRGTCCLRAGVEGLSETIRVVSVLGRFLEHSRIFYFRNGGNEEFYLGSADAMTRNLDRRVETVFPIYDPELRRRLKDEILAVYLNDNCRAQALQPDGSYKSFQPGPEETPCDSQETLLAWARKRHTLSLQRARLRIAPTAGSRKKAKKSTSRGKSRK